MSKKKEKEAKTNAMRLLDMLHVPYRHYSYGCREFVDAWHTAQALGLPAEKMYKTLVTEGAPRQYYVFVIPIGAELSLKKAARAVIDSSAEALPEMVVSGGRLGCQIELSPVDLCRAAEGSFADVAEIPSSL